MNRLRLTSSIILFVCLFILFSGCKKNPITANSAPGLEMITVVCSPASAGPGSVITIAVLIAGNDKEIRVFGLDLKYDSQMFEFESAGKGNLNPTWAIVDGNAVAAGAVKVGGYVGDGNPIAIESNGVLGLIKLKVTGDKYGNGQKSQVWIRQYTDDIAEFTPQSAYAVFTLNK